MAKRLVLSVTALAALALPLAACGGGGMAGAPPTAQPRVVGMAPVTTAAGIQQFAVPADGRSLYAMRLHQLVPGPLQDAQISNAWRTAASANVTPNDYAACVEATSPAGTQRFMIVKSGGGTGDVIAGAAAEKRCSDPSRVVQWVPLDEALQG